MIRLAERPRPTCMMATILPPSWIVFLFPSTPTPQPISLFLSCPFSVAATSNRHWIFRRLRQIKKARRRVLPPRLPARCFLVTVRNYLLSSQRVHPIRPTRLVRRKTLSLSHHNVGIAALRCSRITRMCFPQTHLFRQDMRCLDVLRDTSWDSMTTTLLCICRHSTSMT